MEVTCKAKDTLELTKLVDFQGGLKNRTSDDVEKIITSIKKFGFATPFFVWKHEGINHVLDGHGRLLALRKMRSLGETIPPLPVVYVDCKSEDQARQLLLRITSQYGTMTNQSVLEFMKGLNNKDLPKSEGDTACYLRRCGRYVKTAGWILRGCAYFSILWKLSGAYI